ncbi:hypothetical protein SDC9_172984 [bioreactor metagenome]|uniref:Uncharacterized protein n=1 Tax=bioreactor metagenome TaxID=1076179 RepID=A0A645GHV3_9ZZZZ
MISSEKGRISLLLGGRSATAEIPPNVFQCVDRAPAILRQGERGLHQVIKRNREIALFVLEERSKLLIHLRRALQYGVFVAAPFRFEQPLVWRSKAQLAFQGGAVFVLHLQHDVRPGLRQALDIG